MQTFYENWKKTNKATESLKRWVSDPEGLLTGNGHVEGVYEFQFVNEKENMVINAYIGQAGNDTTAADYVAKDCYERILQHLKRMLGNDYLTYWTGLDKNDNDWKIRICLLCEEKNHAKRLQWETRYINEHKPFLQDSKDGKYDLYPTKYGYRRNDLCIHPWTRDGENEGQRRIAFLDKVEELKKAN